MLRARVRWTVLSSRCIPVFRWEVQSSSLFPSNVRCKLSHFLMHFHRVFLDESLLGINFTYDSKFLSYFSGDCKWNRFQRECRRLPFRGRKNPNTFCRCLTCWCGVGCKCFHAHFPTKHRSQDQRGWNRELFRVHLTPNRQNLREFRVEGKQVDVFHLRSRRVRTECDEDSTYIHLQWSLNGFLLSIHVERQFPSFNENY